MSDAFTTGGGCLCGAVRFTYGGPLGGETGAVTLCHCEQCRRAQGYGAAVAPAPAAGFRVIQGRERIVEYVSSPGKKRAFCGACGSPLYCAWTPGPKPCACASAPWTAFRPAW